MPATMRRKMLVVSDAPDCAAIVRSQLAEVLGDWGCSDDLAADAMLVATELVTNAMLHGGGCTSLAAVFDSRSLRLEVGDRASLPPQKHHYEDGAATGRGLYLVDALSAAWGWEAQAAGKLVWAEIGSPSSTGTEHEVLAWESEPAHTDDGVLVRFSGVPVVEYLALQEQNDAIHRDVDLVLIGREEGLRSDLPEDLLRLVQELRSGFGRPASVHRAAVEAAAGAGQATVDLEERLPPSSVDTAFEYVKLLERIEAYAGQGHLLVGRPSDRTVRLRRWFADQLAIQVNGAPRVWGQQP
jgi:anti-sigma regulatory factor (Ser/Thr protein kinase)